MAKTIQPFLMFQDGNAEEAINFYISLFPDSAVTDITRYAAGEQGPAGTVKLARFILAGPERDVHRQPGEA
jgi:predicted 3-demethylubiquinone-9 3-methyltransferase (glyoxalase superfamily)